MTRRLLLAALAVGASLSRPVTFERLLRAGEEPQNWLTYSGTYRSERHTLLKQITRANVNKLELQWVFQSDSREKVEATPLVADGVMYTVSPPNNIVALDAATGRVFWVYHHRPAAQRNCCGNNNRGLAILGNTLFMELLTRFSLPSMPRPAKRNGRRTSRGPRSAIRSCMPRSS